MLLFRDLLLFKIHLNITWLLVSLQTVADFQVCVRTLASGCGSISRNTHKGRLKLSSLHVIIKQHNFHESFTEDAAVFCLYVQFDRAIILRSRSE